VKNYRVCLTQTKAEVVELPARACKTESKFDSISFYNKSARTCKECVFSFRPIFSFAGRKAELLRMFEIFKDFRIEFQRRNAFRSNVSVNDRVNQRWANIIPPPVTCCSLVNRATSYFFSDVRISGKSMRELSAALSPA
jgi:hypothetical protein